MTEDSWLSTADGIQAHIERMNLPLKQAAYNLRSFQSNKMPKPMLLHNELLFAVHLVERDILTQVAVLIREPWSRITVEKMLTLSAHEGELAVESLLAQQSGAVKHQEKEYIRKHLFFAARDGWGAEKKGKSLGKEFESTVKLIRNTTAGHLYGSRGRDRLDTHVPWIWDRIDLGRSAEDVMTSQIVVWAKNVAQRVRHLGDALSEVRDNNVWQEAVNERVATRIGEFTNELDPGYRG